MAEKTPEGKNIITVDLGTPNSEPQWRFFLSTVKYTCYGGARGGGKSWAIIRKALLLAFYYAEIQILVVRREYDQLENPIIQPMLKLLQLGTYTYNKTDYTLDGSDPRYLSADRKVYSAAVTVAKGDIFRCCAVAEGKFHSAATLDEITA